MAYPRKLATVVSVMVAGAGMGLMLGRSAIAEIDPIYFNSPYADSRFHADLTPTPPEFTAPAVFQAGIPQGLGDGCIGCEPAKVAYYHASEAFVDYEPGYVVESVRPAETVLAEADDISAMQFREAEQLRRYSYYRISVDEPEEDSPSQPVTMQASVDTETEAQSGCALLERCEGAAPGT
jgi:hypothetical protein